MLSIRPARRSELKAIKKILDDLDLSYPTLAMEGFWAAQREGRIIGTLQLAEYKDFTFLGSLAVVREEQNKGVAKELLKRVLKDRPKNIYLYTIIPGFFKKFGFKITPPLPDLPSKNRYQCEYCHSEKCVCMVKYPDAP